MATDSSLTELSAAESKFMNEFTRTMLVEWCDQCIRKGEITDQQIHGERSLYLAYAQGKSWVSKKAPFKVLSGGFTAAAGFLKR